jgi:hypothetical protein
MDQTALFGAIQLAQPHLVPGQLPGIEAMNSTPLRRLGGRPRLGVCLTLELLKPSAG